MAKEYRTHERSRRDDRKRDLFSRAGAEHTLQNGLVVSRYGQQADIRDEQGKDWRAALRQHLKAIAVGDEVEWHEGADGNAVVVNVKARRSALSRPNPYEGLKVIAANIDHILIVIAPVPTFSEVLLDRYLVASAHTGIDASIVLNKCDLLDDSAREEIDRRLQLYRDLGYPVITVSSRRADGLDALRAHMRDGVSVLVGQSGVGKSSLINALVPDAAALTGDVSDVSDLGQHTTSAARLFTLAGGGALIDSPGVREFGLWHLSREDVARGFRDIQRFAGHCKFRNCAHDREPGCAVRAALDSGELPRSRWESYQAILNAPPV